jgi:hypothetical protein
VANLAVAKELWHAFARSAFYPSAQADVPAAASHRQARALAEALGNAMRLIPRRRTCLIIVNACGMVMYLYLASDLRVLPGEDGLPGGPGDAFYWLFFLVPVLVMFMMANLVVLAVIAFRRSGRQRLVATAFGL